MKPRMTGIPLAKVTGLISHANFSFLGFMSAGVYVANTKKAKIIHFIGHL